MSVPTPHPYSLQYPEWSLEISNRPCHSPRKYPTIAFHCAQNEISSLYHGAWSSITWFWLTSNLITYPSLPGLAIRSKCQALSCLSVFTATIPLAWIFCSLIPKWLVPAHWVLSLDDASSKRPSPAALSMLATITLYHIVLFYFFMELNTFFKIAFCLASYLEHMLHEKRNLGHGVHPTSPAPRRVPGT